MKGERFVSFLNDISQANINNQIAMIFDNAPCHLRALQPPQVGGLNINGNHIVRNLPPYSSFLNPVENAISAYKSSVKNMLEEIRPQLLQEGHDVRMARLTQLSEKATTPEKALHWYNLTQQHFPACINQINVFS